MFLVAAVDVPRWYFQ